MAFSESPDFSSQLIAAVRGKKCLYYKSDAFYYNKIIKQKAWEEISTQVNKPLAECKDKWKLLRERFTRELKKKEVPSGCEELEWLFYQEMLFLRDSIQPRRSRTTDLRFAAAGSTKSLSLCGAWVEEFEEEEETSGSSPRTTAKRKKTTIDGLYEEFGEVLVKLEELIATSSKPPPDESDEDFFKVALAMIKDLPQQVKDDIKDSIMEIILIKKKKLMATKY